MLHTYFKQLKFIKQNGQSKMYFFMILETISVVSFGFLAVIIPKVIIDTLNTKNIKTAIYTVAVLLALSGILKIFSLASNFVFDESIIKIRMKSLKQLFLKQQQVDYYKLEQGDFLDKMQTAIDAFGEPNKFTGTYLSSVKLASSGISVCIYLFIISKLEMKLLLFYLFSIIIFIVTDRYFKKFIEKNQNVKAFITRKKLYYTNLGYKFSNGKDIRIFNLRDNVKKIYQNISKEYLSNIKKEENVKLFTNGIFFIALCLQNIFTIYVVGKQYFAGNINLADATLFLTACFAIFAQLILISDTCKSFENSIIYAKTYFEVVQTKHDNTEISNQIVIAKENIKYDIEFKNVSFKYPNSENWALKNLNFKIDYGQKVAFVGVNGAGKSTITKLLMGLYPATEGEILIGGINISSIKPSEMLNLFSPVFQDINIYACTIMQNILGSDDKNNSYETAKNWLENLKLDKKISTYKYGYDTQMLKAIDSEGIEMSGGENQKLSIIRAAVKDAPIFVFDEAASALDAFSESDVYKQVNEQIQDKTGIYISHRLFSCKDSDMVFVLSKGKLVQSGTHNQLMTQQGEYKTLYDMQAIYYKGGESIEDV